MEGIVDRSKEENHPFAVGGKNNKKAKHILSETKEVHNEEQLISDFCQVIELETVRIEEIRNHLNHLGLKERKAARLITKWATK